MDIKTMILLLIIGHILVSVLTYGYFKNHKNYTLQISFIALVLFIFAYSAMYYRAFYPTMASILLSNAFLIAGMGTQACTLLYAIEIWDKKLRETYIIATSLAMMGFFFYVILENFETTRIIIITSISFGIYFYPTYKLLIAVKSTLYRRMLGFSCMVIEIAFLIRIGDAIVSNNNYAFLGHSFSNSLAFAILYAIMIINGVGLVLLIKENDDIALYKAATEDYLTGISNRSTALKDCEKQIEMSKRKKMPIAMMVLDLDYFKKINDEFGHSTGDEVLKKFTQIISKSLRPYDIFGRIGGEEFVVVLPDTIEMEALIIAERLRLEVKVELIEPIPVTVSIGLHVRIPEKEDGFNSLFHEADEALYIAKKEGRNRVHIKY